MADKLDAFDVNALEGAVNDSATRVSVIWVSFLIFALYLLIAATTVTQRQLLLADPITLPVLNIQLPPWVFFPGTNPVRYFARLHFGTGATTRTHNGRLQ